MYANIVHHGKYGTAFQEADRVLHVAYLLHLFFPLSTLARCLYTCLLQADVGLPAHLDAFVIDDLLSAQECLDLIDAAEVRQHHSFALSHPPTSPPPASHKHTHIHFHFVHLCVRTRARDVANPHSTIRSTRCILTWMLIIFTLPPARPPHTCAVLVSAQKCRFGINREKIRGQTIEMQTL